MKMSTYIVAFRPPDDKWRQMKSVFDSCRQADIEPPDEIIEFFDGKDPQLEGVEIEIREAVEEWNDGDMCNGFQVNLEKLPSDVKFIRFYNSY